MFLAIAALATCFASGAANAQAAFQGKFTLPYEVRWGKAVLAPGDYLLTFTHDKMATMLIIRDVKSSRIVAYEPANIREDSTAGESALLIGGQGHQRVVYSFRATELGTTFVCDPKLAHPRASREEARQAQAIPVLQAKK
jgi:hypothetical protein